MKLLEKATIIHYHRRRIETHRAGTVEALGWREKDSQTRRFEVIEGVGDLNGRVVLDVGCGYGDLKPFLDERLSGFTYIGLDHMPEFIAEAKERFKDNPETYFYQTDFTTAVLPQVDYVIASGALVYRCDDPHFYTDMIQKMYAAATYAVAFNMLDAQKFPKHPLLVGHDRGEIVSFCKEVAHDVEVISGYLDDDFTVFLHKQRHPKNKS